MSDPMQISGLSEGGGQGSISTLVVCHLQPAMDVMWVCRATGTGHLG